MPKAKLGNDASIEASVAEILDSLEIETIDPAARKELEHMMRRKRMFGQDARGDLVFLIRVLTESEGNSDALIKPVIWAVDLCMPRFAKHGLALIEAMDNIPLVKTWDTLRGLRLGSEADTMFLLATSIRNHLIARLEPVVAKPVKIKPEPKLPASVTRVPTTERNIARGLEMLALRAEIKHNMSFGRALRRRFEVDGQEASELMRAARAYGSRPDIYRRLSWAALLALSSQAMPGEVRNTLEERIRSGERVAAHEIRAARGARKTGRPKQSLRMAA
jgi:hypothetical protein